MHKNADKNFVKFENVRTGLDYEQTIFFCFSKQPYIKLCDTREGGGEGAFLTTGQTTWGTRVA